MKKNALLLLFFVLFFHCVNSFSATVLDFEDLEVFTLISGTNYAGLTWEFGNQGLSGLQGRWAVPPSGYPNSGSRNIINTSGATLMGISFPAPVDIIGTYIAAQGLSDWTTGVRVHGYLEGTETSITDWFTDIDDHADWFPINLQNVDRIVFESIPTIDGVGGFFGIDDFTYIPEPTTISLLALGAMLAGKRRKK